MTIKADLLATIVFGSLAMGAARGVNARPLEIYFIDVEGGQSTLVVTPQGETLLIDAGYAGDGTLPAKPGPAEQARDANRILAVIHNAGVAQIDYLLVTHFHPDHFGGVADLAKLLPIRTFIDHGTAAEVDRNTPAALDALNRYVAVRATGRHIEPKPGDRLPLKGVEATVVSSAAATITTPIAGAGKDNPVCGPSARPAENAGENPRSTGVVINFGKFRFLDIGDLTGQPLFNLVCPRDLIGPVDVYLVAHHGGADAAEPATFAAFKPRVAVMNNGATKGGAPATYQALHLVPGLEDVWQLHRAEGAATLNYAPARIANLDESSAHWIKVSAAESGAFRVTNGRTGESVSYPARESAPD